MLIFLYIGHDETLYLELVMLRMDLFCRISSYVDISYMLNPTISVRMLSEGV